MINYIYPDKPLEFENYGQVIAGSLIGRYVTLVCHGGIVSVLMGQGFNNPELRDFMLKIKASSPKEMKDVTLDNLQQLYNLGYQDGVRSFRALRILPSISPLTDWARVCNIKLPS